MNYDLLFEKAKEALSFSYAPYSGFNVGAALLGENGKIYTGCNIENASFSPTVCAERCAIFKAVSEGERKFKAILIIGGKNGNFSSFCPPCGVCRQVLCEFCGTDFKVILAKNNKEFKEFKLEKILPLGFKM